MPQMNQQIKQQWTHALRSGQYRQTFGALRMDAAPTPACPGTPSRDGNVLPGGYCVMGVLCDLHSAATGTPWVKTAGGRCFDWLYVKTATSLAYEVRQWAGLEDMHVLIDLATYNDRGETFEELARRIEETL